MINTLSYAVASLSLLSFLVEKVVAGQRANDSYNYDHKLDGASIAVLACAGIVSMPSIVFFSHVVWTSCGSRKGAAHEKRLTIRQSHVQRTFDLENPMTPTRPPSAYFSLNNDAPTSVARKPYQEARMTRVGILPPPLTTIPETSPTSSTTTSSSTIPIAVMQCPASSTTRAFHSMSTDISMYDPNPVMPPLAKAYDVIDRESIRHHLLNTDVCTW
jgi:hypothetical protein